MRREFATLAGPERAEFDAAFFERKRRLKVARLWLGGVVALFIVISVALRLVLIPGALIILPFVFWANSPVNQWAKRWHIASRDRNRILRQALKAARSR